MELTHEVLFQLALSYHRMNFKGRRVIHYPSELFSRHLFSHNCWPLFYPYNLNVFLRSINIIYIYICFFYSIHTDIIQISDTSPHCKNRTPKPLGSSSSMKIAIASLLGFPASWGRYLEGHLPSCTSCRCGCGSCFIRMLAWFCDSLFAECRWITKTFGGCQSDILITKALPGLDSEKRGWITILKRVCSQFREMRGIALLKNCKLTR